MNISKNKKTIIFISIGSIVTLTPAIAVPFILKNKNDSKKSSLVKNTKKKKHLVAMK